MNVPVAIVLCFAGYLAGAVPASYLLTRWVAGVDLRTVGSGNLGFTNAARVLGWKTAVWVLVYDVVKGFLPALLFPKWCGVNPDAGARAEMVWLALAVAPVVGHIFPVFMRFNGGKGVATSIGMFLALAPWAALVALAVGVGLIAATRYVSLGSMTGAVVLAVAVPFLAPGRRLLAGLAVAMALLVIYLHRANIRRLLNGTENRLGRWMKR